MRALRLVGFVVGGLVLLLVILLLAVRLLVDPNEYKERIAQEVKRSTGRELTLSGPIKLAVFPWLALEIGPASLGNPPGFGSEPFAAVEHAAFRVKLLPLLRKQLQIGKVEIDGLDLRLRKNAAGKGNWQDFGDHNPPPSATPSPSSGSTAAIPDLAGVIIKDTRLSYQDMVADHVSLELGHLAAREPVPLKLHLDLTSGAGAKPIDISGQLVATLDPDNKRYSIASLEISGTMSPGSAAVPWKLSIPELNVDLTAQTLTAPGFAANLASARLAGSLQGQKVVDAPAFTGSFKLDPLALRDLMTKLGMQPPVTRDPQAMAKLAAQGNFEYRTNVVSATDVDIQLDDSHLRGKVAVDNLKTKAARFDLGIDRIDMDRYRGPEETAHKPADTRARKTSGSATEPSTSDALKTLDLNGTFKIGNATVAGLSMSRVLVTIAARDGLTHIAPARAKLYGGDYSGDITLDDRGAQPTLKIDQSMTGIDIAPLLKDMTKSQRISGRGTVTTNLIAHGLSGESFLQTLDGHVAANLENGAIEGLDLWFEINRAIALIQKQPLPAGSGNGRTKFDVFKVSADLANGVASTRDLNIASQNLHVTGQGTTNLVTNAINYQVKATVLKESPNVAVSTKSLAEVPLNITGSLTSPTVRPDLEAMAKSRVQQELDKHKDELQQKLMDKLKGIFK
jgi:AsmA protein